MVVGVKGFECRVKKYGFYFGSSRDLWMGFKLGRCFSLDFLEGDFERRICV